MGGNEAGDDGTGDWEVTEEGVVLLKGVLVLRRPNPAITLAARKTAKLAATRR